VDADGNGEISFAEYKDILLAWGGKEEEAATCFQKRALDGNGYFEMSLYPKRRRSALQKLKEYFLSNEPEVPGNYLYRIPF
jgi:hypothetical protein